MEGLKTLGRDGGIRCQGVGMLPSLASAGLHAVNSVLAA